MKALHTDRAPKAIGPYSQAIEANGLVFVSGQLPVDPATGKFVEGGIKEQTRQSLTNAQHILVEAGTDLSHVAKTTIFLSDMGNFAAMNEVYAQFFKEPFPARSAVAVRTLPKEALVEVECIAVK
ncbi:putative endoribonuclease L-PSP [Hoylesella oralis ATCC 33269]|jgi:putative endoribonuclease L-PSP|uniref:Endoribonuclease L-PSP n=1 Tax=Hoylesella oralis ATCC 33269 TaxID=873533 RepID=E7RLW5_9BACT|nr:RidA family protein [Hoylesella oralis]EFZ37746.1 putative endoribonuclease L-PSP [Hoylesella oralis ATCC 33269]EPH16924.1 hypothetical protein HMPREF1475_01249 [Hoylesella oralis HGA0225]SHF47119.1 2-iminobutanoate/2-iminopropanoate deaminase [Hoylesella oralis]